MNSTDEVTKTVSHYDKQCNACGIKNVMPPPDCDMWETPSVKYQPHQKITLNAHTQIGGGLYADEFAKVKKSSCKTWNHLNEKTLD